MRYLLLNFDDIVSFIKVKGYIVIFLMYVFFLFFLVSDRWKKDVRWCFRVYSRLSLLECVVDVGWLGWEDWGIFGFFLEESSLWVYLI